VTRPRTVLLLAGLVLVAINLRVSITSVGPVIGDIRHDLGLSGAAVGLLTTAPLLAFGLVAPLAPGLTRRLGSADRVLLGCLLVIAAGTAARLLHPFPALLLGTTLAGCGIAIANVLLPSIVKGRFAERAALMMGLYSLALGVGGTLGAGLAVPIEQWAGGSWRVALGIWTLPALAAVLLWLPQLRARPAHAEDPGGPPGSIRLGRDRVAWAVTGFMALQSLMFYTVGSWLPEIYRAAGLSAGHAGALLSLLMLVSIGGSFLTALAIGRLRDQQAVGFAAVGLTAGGLLGVLLAPSSGAVVWAVLLGLGLGSGFTLVLTVMVLRAPDAGHAAALSAMAQSVGYTLGAIGPIGIGALHDVSNGWHVPLIVLLVLSIPELALALGASRRRQVGRLAEGRREEAATRAAAPSG
jgi:MFS transporter, CP family, cyanate transporter